MQKITPTSIGVASTDGLIWATDEGSVKLGILNLSNVLYSLKLTGNLVSIGRLCDDGYHAVFHKDWGVILDAKDRVVIKMFRNSHSHRLWFLEYVTPHTKAFHTTVSNRDIAKLWHSRLGHSHPDAVIKFLRVHMNISLSRRDFSACDSCAMGKLIQTPSTSSFHRAPSVLNLIHSDILGPIHPPTPSGARYILTFIDDHTRFNVIYLLKHKSQAFDKFREFKSMMEKRMGVEIVKLKSDRGGEYTSTNFLTYLREAGTEIEQGPADRPQANLVAKKFNLTILSKIRTQLVESGVPLHLWGEAAVYSSLQINCVPSKADNLDIPICLLEKLSRTHIHPFDIERLKPFGSLCFALDRKRPSKVSPTARRLIFVGLEPNARASRLWDKSTSRVLVTGDVLYREDVFPAHDPNISASVNQNFIFPDLSDHAPSPDNSVITPTDDEPALHESNPLSLLYGMPQWP